MAQYRFVQMAQALKNGPIQLLKGTPSISSTGSPTFVYKPILSLNSSPAIVTSAVRESSGGHGHDVHIPPAWKGSENWKTWKDVPDDWIPKTSKRDPDNLVYAEPRYIKLRKQQVFAQRPSAAGTPVYIMHGMNDKVKNWIAMTGVLLVVAYSMYLHYQNIWKKYYPDSNLFILF